MARRLPPMTTAERTTYRIAKARVVLNKDTLAQLDLALADGLMALAQEVITSAQVPDAPPYGVGLVNRGGAIAYVGRRLVGSFGGSGESDERPAWADENYLSAALWEGTKGRAGRNPSQSVKKPRAATLKVPGVTVIGGYGFPARFQEFGTAKQQAHPFLTPALMAAAPGAEGFIALATEKRLAMSAARKGVGDVRGGTPSAEGKRVLGRATRLMGKVGPQ